MQVKFFSIPAAASGSAEDELNRFLRTHRVLQVERHFCAEGGGYWAMLIEYADQQPDAEAPMASRRERRDYAKELTDEERLRYDRYRDIRRELANSRGIPPYLVFTNEELALLSKPTVLTAQVAKQIKGIAPQRLKDFGHFLFTEEQDHEAGGQPDGGDSLDGKPA